MNEYSQLLIDESPLDLLPSLAVALGLNEAILLQRIHARLSSPDTSCVHKGRKWSSCTIAEWREQLPFWSEETIKRALKGLRDTGILETANLAVDSRDRTLSYTIDYTNLERQLNES